MSSKRRRAKASAAEARKERKTAPRERITKPKGAVPEAMVSARHSAETISRHGRGFSLGEVAGAQLPLAIARRWGLRVDVRRRSVLDGNVVSLRAWAAGAKKIKTEGEVKRIEEELAKVEEEVKEEAVKAEREVKKEVRKVEKEITKKKEPAKKRAPRKKASAKSD